MNEDRVDRVLYEGEEVNFVVFGMSVQDVPCLICHYMLSTLWLIDQLSFATQSRHVHMQG